MTAKKVAPPLMPRHRADTEAGVLIAEYGETDLRDVSLRELLAIGIRRGWALHHSASPTQ